MKKKRLTDHLARASWTKLLRVMKLTAFLVLILVLDVSASLYSQNSKVSVKVENGTLSEIFSKIETQSEYRFFYQNEQIRDVERKSIDVSNKNTLELVSDLLGNTGLTYKLVDRNIIIFPSNEKNNMDNAFQQPKSISGKVTDSSGGSLPGVSVVVKGTTNGTTTDSNGNYSLSKVPDNATLQFSFIGMKTQEIKVGNQSRVNVALAEETIGLEEVVAVGYGIQKKVNLTGAVGVVSSESLVSGPSTNVESSLQGRLPGVTITQTSGEPGQENVSILIRGLGTMGDASPLIIVDGLPSRMNDISPNDIESVSILKDASSAAIYGSRAANGVILITTKRGRTGFSEITYNTSFGWQKATNLPMHLSSAQYAELYNEGLSNEGLAPRYSADDIAKYKSGSDPNFPNTNWVGLLLTEPSFTQDHNLTFSGGNEKTNFRASFEYFDQGGLIKKSGHKRYNSRVNIDSKIRDWFTIGLNTALTFNNVTSADAPYASGNEIFRQANTIPPTIANINADGTWNNYPSASNPIAAIEDGGLKRANNSHLLGSAFGEVKLVKGLTLKNIAGIDYNINDNKDHASVVRYGDGTFQGPNSVNDLLDRSYTISLQSLLNYDLQIKKHGVKALLGASRESSSLNVNSAYRQNFPSDNLDQLNAGSTEGWTNSGYAYESKIGSYFGRINYDYDNKYLFETNLRRDASSKFARDKRVGWFPSMSAGWRMSEEKFMKSIKWIDNLKLRASWGQLGNNRVGDYAYIQRITLGQNYNFGGSVASGAATVNASNSAITWEKTSALDLGIDIDFFKNKLLSVSADYYDRFTDDILIAVPVSIVFGLGAPVVNGGSMRNKGIELLLEHNNTIGDLKYSISFNTAYNENKVEKFPNPYKGDHVIQAEGISWNSFYGYQATGIYQTDAEAAASPHITGVTVKAGDLIYKDQNGDGKIDGDDRVVLGNSIPKITYGANINLKYKGFDATAFFQGASNVYRTLGPESFWPFDNENAETMHLDRTIVANGQVVTQGHYPRTVVNQKGNRVQSSFNVLDASYLRLKNIQLGYSLPASWLSAVKISKARVYLSGQNLLTLTKFPKGFDPEIADNSVDWTPYRYPQVKFYTFGFDVTF